MRCVRYLALAALCASLAACGSPPAPAVPRPPYDASGDVSVAGCGVMVHDVTVYVDITNSDVQDHSYGVHVLGQFGGYTQYINVPVASGVTVSRVLHFTLAPGAPAVCLITGIDVIQ
jgi:hypothetical protein